MWDEASAYGDVVYEYNSSGSMLASYVLGGTGIISQTRSGTTNYFLQDGQDSTRALTNSTTGAITDTYSYTAFGELFSSTGTTTNAYRYTGQQFDTNTGLYSLRARYYNPALGRFLSQDAYPVNFSNPVELNRYVYTANSPINAIDPSGHVLLENISLNLGRASAAITSSYFVVRGYYTLMFYILQLVPYSADEINNFLSIGQRALQPIAENIVSWWQSGSELQVQPGSQTQTASTQTESTETSDSEYSIALGHAPIIRGGFPIRHEAIPYYEWESNGLTSYDVTGNDFPLAFDEVVTNAQFVHFAVNGVSVKTPIGKGPDGSELDIYKPDLLRYDRDAALSLPYTDMLAGHKANVDWTDLELIQLKLHPEWYLKMRFYFVCGFNGPDIFLGDGNTFFTGANKTGSRQNLCP